MDLLNGVAFVPGVCARLILVFFTEFKTVTFQIFSYFFLITC